jgi:hypothetical protein
MPDLQEFAGQLVRSWRQFLEEVPYEEGFRAALDGPKKVGTGETLTGVTAPTFSATCAPVLELVDSRDLHSRG